ncbi:hypothetical protein L211DRAFT_865500 [Terfezia boudieri ATCC MYA-4762]|uniref:Uncharacterized protein n=1 Tax=Terfezia boudieri ATCC MYA-4762 TaxID=1051890 RepID=A0A3N4LYV6_9PEZI|nr:hypothetical protein L211DRAFT_865500 [Terfezia boudieri ATCC MYA-4762]
MGFALAAAPSSGVLPRGGCDTQTAGELPRQVPIGALYLRQAEKDDSERRSQEQGPVRLTALIRPAAVNLIVRQPFPRNSLQRLFGVATAAPFVKLHFEIAKEGGGWLRCLVGFWNKVAIAFAVLTASAACRGNFVFRKSFFGDWETLKMPALKLAQSSSSIPSTTLDCNKTPPIEAQPDLAPLTRINAVSLFARTTTAGQFHEEAAGEGDSLQRMRSNNIHPALYLQLRAKVPAPPQPTGVEGCVDLEKVNERLMEFVRRARAEKERLEARERIERKAEMKRAMGGEKVLEDVVKAVNHAPRGEESEPGISSTSIAAPVKSVYECSYEKLVAAPSGLAVPVDDSRYGSYENKLPAAVALAVTYVATTRIESGTSSAWII